jgi:hypothetical protein
MRILYIGFFLVVGMLETFATMQHSDILIWNGDTLYLNKSPLEELPEVCERIRKKEKIISSDCWNGFVAEWIIIDNTLHLKNIYSCSTRKNINSQLERILNRKFVNGSIKADWFSSSIIGGLGKKLNRFYFIVYEKERLLKFEQGELKQIKEYNAENIEFSIDKNVVEEFIYKNIDWNIFNSDEIFFKRVSVFVLADSQGKINKIEFEESAGDKVDSEIKRILMLIPNWGKYYWNGDIYEFSESYSLKFNNEQMNKYAR